MSMGSGARGGVRRRLCATRAATARRVLAGLVWITIGCADSSGPDEASRCVVTGIGISPASATVEVGSSVDVSAAVEPITCRNTPVVWSTDDAAVATVVGAAATGATVSGKISGVGPGVARITAAADTFKAVTVVTVRLPDPARPGR